MRIPNIYITDNLDNLEVRVIGYKSLGESIIINIGKSFVMVIDSYKCYGKFLTKDILEQIGVSKLTMLCWTHPDADHTVGMGELFNYVGENTYVIVPDGISMREIEISLLSDIGDEKNNINEYKDIYTKINEVRELNLIVCNQSTSIEFNIIQGKKTYPCKIEFFAPIGSIIRNQQINNYKTIIDNKDKSEYLNLYSIAMKFYIGDIKLCFTGDLDNKIIDCFSQNNEYYRDILIGYNDIFKIPHHGSCNASSILEYIIGFKYGIVTSYRKGTVLPNEDMLREYSKFGDVYATRKETPADDYGIVHVKIPLVSSEKDTYECLYDAYKWNE